MPLFFCRTSTSANILDLDNSINQEEWGPFTNHIGRIDCSHSRLPTAVPTRKPVEAGREMHVVPNSDSRSDHNRTNGKARQGSHLVPIDLVDVVPFSTYNYGSTFVSRNSTCLAFSPKSILSSSASIDLN